MKNKYKIILIVLSISFLGLIAIHYCLNIEKIHTLKQYSSTGKLISTYEYVIRDGDTIMQGKFLIYNKKGNKFAEGQFLDGHINGKCIYYSDNGKIESTVFKKNKIDLERTFYNPSGLIDKYVMYNDYGEAKFFIDFEKKTVKKYDGYVIYPINQYKIEKGKRYEIYTRDTLKVGDVIKYDYLLANIPYTKRTFKIETEGIDNSKVQRTIDKEVPTRIVVQEVLTKKGLNRIKAITQFVFDDKVTPVKNDTASFDVNVK